MLYSFYHWTNWMSYDGNMYRVYRSHWLRHGPEASERCCMDLYKMFNKSGVRRYLMIIIPLIFHFFFLCFFKQKTRTHKKYADKRKTAETWNQKLYCFPSYASPANHNSVFLSLSLSLSTSLSLLFAPLLFTLVYIVDFANEPIFMWRWKSRYVTDLIHHACWFNRIRFIFHSDSLIRVPSFFRCLHPYGQIVEIVLFVVANGKPTNIHRPRKT